MKLEIARVLTALRVLWKTLKTMGCDVGLQKIIKIIENCCLDDVTETGKSKRNLVLFSVVLIQCTITLLSVDKVVPGKFLVVSVFLVALAATVFLFCRKNIHIIVEKQERELRTQRSRHNVLYGKETMPMIGILFALVSKIVSVVPARASCVILDLASLTGCFLYDATLSANDRELILGNIELMLTMDAWIFAFVFIAVVIFPNYIYYAEVKYVLDEKRDK